MAMNGLLNRLRAGGTRRTAGRSAGTRGGAARGVAGMLSGGRRRSAPVSPMRRAADSLLRRRH